MHGLGERGLSAWRQLWQRVLGLTRRWSLTRRQRRLLQSVLTGLVVAGAVLLAQRGGLFSSAQASASDYLYQSRGDPGDDIAIVAIDDKSQAVLGDWPWSFVPYIELFERLQVADVVGFDVLLSDAGPAGNADALALVEAVRRAGNVVMPLASLELRRPATEGALYSVGQIVRPFPALLDVADDQGIVVVGMDVDGTLRRIPLMVNAGEETLDAFSLSVLRHRAALEGFTASLEKNQIVIGDESEVKYRVETDGSGAMLVNFVGEANTFPVYSFVDVIQDRIEPGVFAGKIVLVGMMNTVGETDLHRTPVAAGRMSGIEFQANAIHTLLTHHALRPPSQTQTMLIVIVLALVSALALSQFGAVAGAGFTVALAVAYFFFTNWQFDRGQMPNALFPFATILISYAVVMAVRFASEQVERNRVSDMFGRFVSPEIRDTIVNMALDNPSTIRPGGELREISVLFADIRGFTTLSENLSPPEVVEILNLYLDSMEEQVFKQGGTLDKYTGDGMMVLFGAPLAQADHAVRVVRAALDMQQAAAEVSKKREAIEPAGGMQWRVAYGIGITTGPAVVGQIGSQRRLDYTAIGDTVNLAARLEGKAPAGTILINRATYEAVKGLVLAEELPPMEVKGKAEPVVAYRVLGLKEMECK